MLTYISETPRFLALALQELNLHDHSGMLLEAKRSGYKWVGVLRPDNSTSDNRGFAHGGVGLIVSADARVTVLHTFKKGVLTVRLDIPDLEPLFIVTLYVPPAGSVLNKHGRKWSAEIMADAREQVDIITASNRNVLVLGDINHQPGSDNGRRVTADPHKRGGNTPAFWAWARAMNMSPVHGRPGQPPGFCTSRAADPAARRDGHEVDVIMANANCTELHPTGMRVEAQPPIAWGLVPSHLTHRPVFSTVSLPPLPPADDEPIAPSAPARRWWQAPYSSPSWHAAADSVLPLLLALLPTLLLAISTAAQWPGAPSTVARQTIDNLYTSLLETLFSAYQHARLCNLEEPDKTPRFQPGPRRRHKGMHLPAEVIQLVERARLLHKASHRIGLTAERREALKAELKLACRERDNAARRILRSNRNAAKHELEHLSIFDQHRLHKLLEQISPDDPDVAGDNNGIPDEPGFPPALSRVYDYFRRALGEDRGLPPGATCAEDLADFPQYDDLAPDLLRPISAGEVYLALMPPHKKLLNQWPGCNAQAGCHCCDGYRRQLEAWDRKDGDCQVPKWRPRIWTGKAAGPDRMPAEVLRFTRAVGIGDVFSERWLLCQVLASSFQLWLTTRYVPSVETFRDSCLVLLRKAVPLNAARPNPADPKSRRPIQCVGVIPKLFECILAARITHALLRRGFFGDSQGAFLPLHGAETHVWTLVEVLRMRRNLGLDSYLLFVDFRNAYNEVHLGGLTAILRHVGFPPDLVELLQEWGDSRTTSARVNGSDSLPFATNRGVPQGSALSPILFIIFMVGLANRLARTPGLRGVTVPSRADNAAGAQGPGDVFRLLQLIYADDVAVTCDSPQQLQLALNAITQWGARWHMQLVSGAGKTEAMAIEHDAEAPNTGLPPVVAGVTTVNWTAQYKYLGYILQWDLSNSGMLARLGKRLAGLSGKHFTCNRVVRSLSPSLQLQLATTLITGSCAYLMGVVPFTETETEVLSSAVRKLGRVIFSLPHNTASSLVSSASRLQCFASITAMHQMRLYHHLRTTPYRTGIAAQLFDFMQRDPPRSGRDGPWLQRFSRACEKRCARGAQMLPDQQVTHPEDVHRAAVIFGRSVAWSRWRFSLQLGTNAHNRSVDITTRPSAREHTHVSELHFLGSLPSAGLGLRAFATPQSYTGPGATSIEALSTLSPSKLIPLIRIRRGRIALASWPFRARGAPSAWAQEDYVDEDGDVHSGHFAAREARDEPCRLCGAVLEDPYHILLECPHPPLVAARCTDAELAEGTILVADELARAHARSDPAGAGTSTARALRNAITASAAHLSMSSLPGRALAWRLLTALPFPRSKAGEGVGPAASLGELFDATTLQRRYLRRYANRWIDWARTRVLRGAEAWAVATGAVALRPNAAPYQPADA